MGTIHDNELFKGINLNFHCLGEIGRFLSKVLKDMGGKMFQEVLYPAAEKLCLISSLQKLYHNCIRQNLYVYMYSIL